MIAGILNENLREPNGPSGFLMKILIRILYFEIIRYLLKSLDIL